MISFNLRSCSLFVGAFYGRNAELLVICIISSCPLIFSCAVPQFWTTFCRADNSVISSLLPDDFFDIVGNSRSRNSSVWSWLIANLLKPCPQRALVSLFHIVFFIFFLVHIIYQKLSNKSSRQTRSPFVTSSYFKVTRLCCLYIFIVNLGVLFLWIIDGFQNGWSILPLDSLVSAAAQTVAWGVMYFATEETRKQRHQFFPTILRSWWILAFVLSAVTFLSSVMLLSKEGVYFWAAGVETALFPAALFLGYTGLRGGTGIEVIADHQIQEPLLNASESETSEEEPLAPYQSASLLSLATLSWLNSLLVRGKQKPLEISDMPPLAKEDRAEVMYGIFLYNWEALKKKDPSKTPSISVALRKSLWSVLTVNGVFALLNILTSYVGPYLINDFVEYLGGRRRFEHEGYILVAIFGIAKLIENVSQRQSYYGVQFIGLKVKAALTVVVFRKSLRLSSQARSSHSSGEIINYMSVDVQRLYDFTWYLNQIWILPVEIALALAILYKVVGMAWVAALMAACFTLFLNTPIEKTQEGYQDKVMAAKDERMKALAECLRNMRVLKLQAWEQRFLLKIEEMRQGEYGWLLKDCIARAFGVYIFWLAPIAISVATFGTCVLVGIPLTSGRVLSAIATFRVLQQALSSFPELVSFYAQTKVSLDRLRNFLQEEELPTDAVIHVPKEESGDVAVDIEKGEFNWNTLSTERPTLMDINLRVKSGARVAVCGSVGSGKTSLLSCILGEIPKLGGTVKVSGTTAYVAQSAWIQTGKVEDNIRFGKAMNRERYDAILNACALRKDLELWAFGDQTEIGERGINMSGGQKQRIQLARALYQDSDIYLLDDPFSAVDAHTGSQLFRECILGTLASKTVVYVTHQVEFLPAADLILVLDKGAIVQAGKYDDLLQAGTNFQGLVNAHNEAIDGMDVNDCSKDDEEETTVTGEVSSNGFQSHHVGEELQRQKSLKKSDSVVMRKQNSTKEKEEHVEAIKRQLIEEEKRERGSVSFQVYWSYATAIYKGALVVVIILCQICFTTLQIGSNYWMAWASPTKEGDPGKMSSTKLILVYTGLSFGSSLFVIIRSLLVSLAGLFIAQKYFLEMIRCIFRAPMSFFDSTPAGRILNRASSDQSQLDSQVQYDLSSLVVTAIQLMGVVAVMSQIGWAVPLFFLPVAATCLWMQQYYMTSAREVARVMGVEKSPILNHYGESIAGAATIRGFRQHKCFMDTTIELFDSYSRPCFLQSALIEWLIFRMELLCTIVFSFSMILVVAFPDNTIDPSLAGLAVTYGLNLNMLISWTIYHLCDVETRIISVERIQQSTRIQSEAPLLIEKCRPSPLWPSRGTIELQHLQIRYSSHSPLVLHGITCTIQGGKKVGVVGRTGSGKSTLIQALFRVVEPVGGRIMIDGLDITTIGLHDLRLRLSIIPQDSTLFEGTMRTNLDPLEEHTDVEVWEALDKCQLGDAVRAKDRKLDAAVGENGDNWSGGQRQLVCLGRALLKRTRILVLDEATASVDSATDTVIQRIIRTEFSNCTVVTVAHRIPTVVDSDQVLVLSDGRISEYDAPVRLLENKNSLFAKLVAEYTIRSTNSITDLSSMASDNSVAV